MTVLVTLVLLACVVSLSIALVVVTRDVSHRSQVMVAQAHHEMRTLLSAVLSSSAGEFAQVERALANTRTSPTARHMSEVEYEDRLRGVMSGMGYDTDQIPSVPEGL